MSITFRPAIRENVNLILGVVGGTGAGKSFSSMRLAAGIAGDKPFAVIDADNRRALHYADKFRFDHAEIRAPFTPDAFADAITAADKAGYPVIVVDPMSLVWVGEGGVLDWQEAELDRMAGSDWKKREACKMAAWIKPKLAHKHMMQKLLQVRAHIILALRAEEKIEMVKDEHGKLKIVPKVSATGHSGWIPVCEKNLPFELTASFLLTADHPGIPKPIKLQEQHKALFPLDKPLTEESGRLIAQWANGGSSKESAPSRPSSAPQPTDATAHADATGTTADHITAEQVAQLETRCTDNGIDLADLKRALKVDALADIPAAKFASVGAWLTKQIDVEQEA